MWKRTVLSTLCVLLASYLSAGVFFWATQDNKILNPLKKIASDPGQLGMDFERIKINIGPKDQNGHLDGFWIPSGTTNAPLILFLHGQDDNIGKNLFHAQHLHNLGLNVLLVDYRGFGRSPGDFSPSEASVYADADTAWNYLVGDRRIPRDKIFLYGHSLGGAIAIELATRHPDAAGLIVESGFTSVTDMAHWKFPFTHLLPLDRLLRHKFDSIAKVGQLQIPVLFIHGTGDEKVPPRMSVALHEAATTTPAKLVKIEGGGHADCCLVGTVEHANSIRHFIQQ